MYRTTILSYKNWDSVLDGSVDPDIRAQVIGVQAQMESFNYFFGISVGELVLSHGDNLSAALQSSSISATEGQRVASLTVNTLAKIRTAESYLYVLLGSRSNFGIPRRSNGNIPAPSCMLLGGESWYKQSGWTQWALPPGDYRHQSDYCNV